MSEEKKFSKAAYTMVAAIRGSMTSPGMRNHPNTAQERVSECATVKPVTIFTTGQRRVAHSRRAIRKAMWS